MKPLTAVAVSGGVDSLMAAYLLKEQGHNVIGVHFLTGYEDAACFENQANHIDHIAKQLDITVKTIDCSVEFKKKIVDYFIATYLNGKTPNPCLMCNPLIKFGTVLEYCSGLGASRLATGHYAAIKIDDTGGFHLLRGKDRVKDQSYFLAFMTQGQLARACFPLGNMTKSEVVKLAKDKGFKPAIKAESQDICFINTKTYGQFLERQYGFRAKPGIIQDVHGNMLGEHNGLHMFTTGQRRGINRPAKEPYYVVRIDAAQNRLIVGFKKDLQFFGCKVTNINWINYKPDYPIKIYARLRYRQKAVAATLSPTDTDKAFIRFDNMQSAASPGQGAVFYKGDEVLGAGLIDGQPDCQIARLPD